MSALPHFPHKPLLQPLPTDTTLPPPYESDTDTDGEDEDDDTAPPTTLTITAPTTIHGSSNLLSIAPLDTARISALLLAALDARAAAQPGRRRSRGRRGRGAGAVSVAINCGISVVGDRNVVGWVGARAPATRGSGGTGASAGAEKPAGDAGPAAVGAVGDGGVGREGRKRMAEEGLDDVPQPKRADVAAEGV